ncbi:MAG: arginine--tRNA ligase [Clostridiales bacterium]|nr:arginine--tRNA ligase [Clostridiales bacterium]
MDYRTEIVDRLSRVTELTFSEVETLVEVPPQKELGDYAFPCYALAKSMRKSPALIAEEIADDPRLREFWIEKIIANGPYVNFFLDRGHVAQTVLSAILDQGISYGKSVEGANKTVIVEFSSPNIAKPFHVGHAFTTVLGNSLSRIYAKLGYTVIRMNHLGDYGTQFGKLITAYRLWGNEQALLDSPIEELLRIYVKFHEEEKKDPELSDRARENFRKLEAGAPEETAIWKKFRDMSLKEFDAIYDKIGVSFDNYNGESFYSSRIPDVLNLLNEKDLLVESEGARVVMLDEYDLPPCIIVKSDGTTIYASRDLAAVMYRFEKYHFYKNIYVVGMPQALHFKQVFAVLDKAGQPYAKDCLHVGFGLVKFKNMKFSTREGNVVVLDDLLNESIAKTREIIKSNAMIRETGMNDEHIDEVASKVGIGAVIYTYLRAGRERDIIFSWEEMLDFEGDSAPYLIYTYARTRSILRKARERGILPGDYSEVDLSLLVCDDESMVVKLIAEIPDAVKKAASSNEPFMVARIAAQIARAFNRFYNNSSILAGNEEELRAARLALCEAICVALRVCTNLLGIEVVEQM